MRPEALLSGAMAKGRELRKWEEEGEGEEDVERGLNDEEESGVVKSEEMDSEALCSFEGDSREGVAVVL